ncbi:hypothetical protein Tco_0552101 [Tanacetum coccineum]
MSATCHSKDSGPLPGLYLCWIVLRYRCIWTELITPNLICPSTYQLLWSSGGDSEPDPSFDKSASLERSFILRVSMEMTDAKVQEEPHHDIRPTLQRLPFYYTPPTAIDVVIPDPTLEDLAVGTPSAKILAKAKASQKRKASTSDNSDDESDDDGDACIEILLVTLIRSDVVIPSSGNQGKSSASPVGIMVDDAVASSASASRSRPSSVSVLTFRDVSRYVIHADFFPFSVGPHYATYPEGGVARNYEFTHEEWDAPYLRRCCFAGNYILPREEQVFGLNDNLYSFDASFAKSKAKRKERKKKIKSLTKSLDNLHAEVARLSDLVWKFLASDEFSRVQGKLLSLAASARFEHGLSMHQTKDEFSFMLKKMAHFVPGALGRLAEVQKYLCEGGTSYVLDDVAEVNMVGSERVSFGPTDVGVILSIGKKGDGPLRSSVADKEATANPFGFRLSFFLSFFFLYMWLSIQRILSHVTRPKQNGFPPGTFSIPGQAFVARVSFLISCYMFPPQCCCSSELFARKEGIIVSPPPSLC